MIPTAAEKLRQDPHLEPHARLGLAIVAVAVEDALALEPGETTLKYGVHTSPWSLLNFFRSHWCRVLLGATDLEGEDFIKVTNLEWKCKL